VADTIITPKQSWWEKLRSGIKSFSPQVKQGLIMASVTVSIALITAIGGCISVYSENSRLRTKVHDLELEALPFRNLAVQQFNKADAESLRKLAESMATLHKDYSTQLETINALRMQIEQLRKANEETERNLFSNMVFEDIAAADTNRVVRLSQANGSVQLMVKLEYAPIPGSLQVTIKPGGGLNIPQNFPGRRSENYKNVLFVRLWSYDLGTTSFSIQYAKDTRETNLVQKVDAVEGVAVFDGTRTRVTFEK
jgi:hypothetical protein